MRLHNESWIDWNFYRAKVFQGWSVFMIVHAYLHWFLWLSNSSPPRFPVTFYVINKHEWDDLLKAAFPEGRSQVFLFASKIGVRTYYRPRLRLQPNFVCDLRQRFRLDGIVIVWRRWKHSGLSQTCDIGQDGKISQARPMTGFTVNLYKSTLRALLEYSCLLWVTKTHHLA